MNQAEQKVLRRVALITAAIVLSGLIVLSPRWPRTARLWEVFPPVEESNRSWCARQNLSYGIGLALMQYTQDYDDKLPLTQFDTGTNGWAEQLQPYTFSANFQCWNEGVPSGNDPNKTGFTDYWFNGNASGKKLGAFPNPRNTFLAGEGNDGVELTDARYHKFSLPPAWITNGSSPAYRHGGGANYLFADGHTKWLKPRQVTTAPARTGQYTFAIR